MKLCMFRTVPLSISRSFSLYTQQWYMSYSFVDSFRAGSGWNWFLNQFSPDPARKLSANLNDLYHCCVCSAKTPDDGQWNCPKHVQFHFKNKSEKLEHVVGFIIYKFIMIHGHMNVPIVFLYKKHHLADGRITGRNVLLKI